MKSNSSLDCYSRLSEANSVSRLKAVESLISDLNHARENKSQEDFTSDVEYTISRLVSGLESCEGATKLGFSLGLTEVLRVFKGCYSSDVIDILHKHLTVKKHTSPICHLLILAAYIRAGIDNEDIQRTCKELASLQKTTNDVAIYELIAELIRQLDANQVKQFVLPAFCSEDSSHNTSFYYWLLCYIHKTFPGTKFKKPDPFAKCNEASFKSILASLHKTSTLPSVHPLVVLTVDRLFACKSDVAQTFWRTALNECLIKAGSAEKYFLLYQFIKVALEKTPDIKFLQCMLSDVFCEHLKQQLCNTANSVHGAAVELTAVLSKWVMDQQSPEVEQAVLRCLLKVPLFDRLSRTQTVRSILLKSHIETVKWFCETFIPKHFPEKNIANMDVRSVTDMFADVAAVLNANTIVDSIELRISVCQYLTRAYLKIVATGQSQPCRVSLLKAICNWPQHKQSVSNSVVTACLNEFKDAGKRAKFITKCLTICDKLGDVKSEKEMDVVFGLQSLILNSALAVVLNVFDDSTIVEDFRTAADGYLRGPSVDDEASWQELTMEAFLALTNFGCLALKNSFYTAMVRLAPRMDEPALQIVLNVFKPADLAPVNGGTDQEDEGGESESSSDDESDDDPDENGVLTMDEDTQDSTSSTDQLRQDLRSVLQVNHSAANSDDEASDMTDADMFRLDDAIAAAFRFRSNNSKRNQFHAESTMLHRHALKILSIIGSKTDVEHVSLSEEAKQTFKIIDALLTTSNKFGSDVEALISDTVLVIMAAKQGRFHSTSASCLKNYTGHVQELAVIAAAKTATPCNVHWKITLAQLMVFLIKCDRAFSGSQADSKWYLKIYTNHLKQFLDSSFSHQNPVVFVKFIEAFPVHSIDLLEIISATFDHIILQRKASMIALATVCFKFLNDCQGRNVSSIADNIEKAVLEALKDRLQDKQIHNTLTREYSALVMEIETKRGEKIIGSSKMYKEELAPVIEELKALLGKDKQKVRGRSNPLATGFKKARRRKKRNMMHMASINGECETPAKKMRDSNHTAVLVNGHAKESQNGESSKSAVITNGISKKGKKKLK